jgi:hypothetical protein
MRPHWWAVLAVSLALLALVAATSSDRPSGSGSHDGARAAGGARHQPASTSPQSPTTTTTTATTMPPTATTTTAPRPATTSTTDIARVVVKESSPTTTTTTVAPTSGNAAAAPAQTVTPREGSLQQPYDTSATAVFNGQGAMDVTATWTPSTTLSLTVSCGGSTQQVEGTSTASVVIPDASGTCTAVLKEMLVQYDGVSYALTIGPEGG